jgi:hypothetical protein
MEGIDIVPVYVSVSSERMDMWAVEIKLLKINEKKI